MSNQSTSAYVGACRKDIPYPSVSHESVPSLIDNLVTALYGSFTKTVVNRKVVWNVPCNPSTYAPIFGVTPNDGEGTLCYIMRALSMADTMNGIVYTNAVQTLTNKTLTNPVINNAILSGTLTGGTFASTTLTAPAVTAGTFSAPTLNTPTINGAALSGTFTGTATGGTFASPVLNTPTINSATFAGTLTGTVTGGIFASTTLNSPTVNGILLNSNVITTSQVIAAGFNGMSLGPITLNDGLTITIASGSNYTIL